MLLLLANNNGDASWTKYGHEAVLTLNRALELFDTHRFSMNHRTAKKSLKEAYDIIGSSESAMVDGKRLLLGYLNQMNEGKHSVESADPSIQSCAVDGNDSKQKERLHSSDSPDIFKTGYDFSAVIRRSPTNR